MKKYDLYLESGPKHRTTMVHVLDLLGCTASGPTTEAALAATPGAIRAHLRLLQRHGERVRPDTSFTTAVAAHVTEGSWIGYGDPAPGFPPDFEPLSADELRTHLRRLSWIHEDLLELLGDVPARRLTAKSAKGRSLAEIVSHIAEAHAAYLRYAAGNFTELSDAMKALRRGDTPPVEALRRLWSVSHTRLDAMTEDERARRIPHGQATWTARRCLRRMLEHDWEHLREISARLGTSTQYLGTTNPSGGPGG